jgi:hypothetical protein
MSTSALFCTFGTESNFFGILIFDLLCTLLCNAIVLDNEHKSALYDLFQYTASIYRGSSKHIIWFSLSLYPITGGLRKDSGGHSLIMDLLQAAMVLVCICQPMSQI